MHWIILPSRTSQTGYGSFEELELWLTIIVVQHAEIKIQNFKSSFYWLHIAFVPLWTQLTDEAARLGHCLTETCQNDTEVDHKWLLLPNCGFSWECIKQNNNKEESPKSGHLALCSTMRREIWSFKYDRKRQMTILRKTKCNEWTLTETYTKKY